MYKTPVRVSIMTMCILAVERYLGICHPSLAFRYKSSKKSRAIKAVIIIWFVGFLCTIPETIQVGLVHHITDPTLTDCLIIDENSSKWAGQLSIFFLSVPMILIFTIYVLIGLRLKKLAKKNENNNESNHSEQRTTKILSKNKSLISYFIYFSNFFRNFF